VDSACPAQAHATAVFGSGKACSFANRPEQRCVRIHVQYHAFTVQQQGHRNVAKCGLNGVKWLAGAFTLLTRPTAINLRFPLQPGVHAVGSGPSNKDANEENEVENDQFPMISDHSPPENKVMA
jgi:hypothetical protein